MSGAPPDRDPLPVLDREVDVGDRLDRPGARAIHLGHAGQLVHRAHPTFAIASAGRSRPIRQLPNAPASRPPRVASPTAAPIAAPPTDAESGTDTVWLVVGLIAPFGVIMCSPVASVSVADSEGAIALMTAAPP